MATKSKPLTARKLAQLTQPGRYKDVEKGLYLQVVSATNRSWLLRYELDHRERWMGLGPVDLVGLADARQRARAARLQLLDGIDPIEARLARRDQQRKEESERITFKQAAEEFLALHEDGWRNAKHRAQWRTTLVQYAYPKLGLRPVQAIDAAVVNDALSSIWTTIPETASRVRLRIEKVVGWVRAGKPLPANGGARRRVKNMAALPYGEIPQFLVELRQRDGVAARALEFLVLTAARTGEVVDARWTEINLEQKVWTIPAERMKSGKEHRVPLSAAAVDILKALPHEKANRFVFIGGKKGAAMSNMAMWKLLQTMRPDGATIHGFRSSFKDWASETTSHPGHVSEMALAHVVQGVEAHYRRGDLFQKRVRLMSDWARYCSTASKASGNVVPLRAR